MSDGTQQDQSDSAGRGVLWTGCQRCEAFAPALELASAATTAYIQKRPVTPNRFAHLSLQVV
jgi:hypothetical protein